MEKVMKPYGYIYSQGQKYLLLNPQPVPKDSQWNDGTYMFFVVHMPYYLRTVNATHIITNSFCIEFVDGLEAVELLNVDDEEESIPVEPTEFANWLDDLSKKPVEEELPF